MPVKMERPQAVVVREKVYVGGGHTEGIEDDHQVFQYDPSQDEWSRLPPHQVVLFVMAQFVGHLITVGGWIPRGGGVTGKVYRFKEQSQKWEESLTPMPTARFRFSLATTKAAIVASGGDIDVKDGKPVPLWRCTVVKPPSGTLLIHYLYFVCSWPLPPSQTPGTNWGDSVLITRSYPLSCTLLLPPSSRKPPHLLTSQLAPCQPGRPSLTPHCWGLLQQV